MRPKLCSVPEWGLAQLTFHCRSSRKSENSGNVLSVWTSQQVDDVWSNDDDIEVHVTADGQHVWSNNDDVMVHVTAGRRHVWSNNDDVDDMFRAMMITSGSMSQQTDMFRAMMMTSGSMSQQTDNMFGAMMMSRSMSQQTDDMS